MKITNDVMEGILPKEKEKVQTASTTGVNFDEIFHDKLADIPAHEKTNQVSANPLSELSQFGLVESADAAAAVAKIDTEEEAVSGVENLLASFDAYAKQLEGNDLKGAWKTLEGVSTDADALQNWEGMKKLPALEEIINEINTLSATERVRFNRGDYF